MSPFNRYATSLMDIILGAIGAFFFLLIILSASRKGIVQEGIEVSRYTLLIRVNRPEKLAEVGTSIHYFVGIGNKSGSSKIERVFFSDIAENDNAEGTTGKPFVKVNDKNMGNIILQLEDENVPVVVGAWLQDVRVPVTQEDLQSIEVNFRCLMFHKERKEGVSLILTPCNCWTEAIDLRNGQRIPIGELCVDNILQRGAEKDKIRKPHGITEEEKERCNRHKDLACGNIHLCGLGARQDSWRIVEEFGYAHKKSKTDTFTIHFLNGLEKTHTQDKSTIFGDFKPRIEEDITYLAVGERAVCAVFRDGSLQFSGTNGKKLSYPFDQYPEAAIRTDEAKQMIDHMLQIEPGLKDAYTPVQHLQMLAEIIAGPNDRKAPYPVVRQNPLLFTLVKK